MNKIIIRRYAEAAAVARDEDGNYWLVTQTRGTQFYGDRYADACRACGEYCKPDEDAKPAPGRRRRTPKWDSVELPAPVSMAQMELFN